MPVENEEFVRVFVFIFDLLIFTNYDRSSIAAKIEKENLKNIDKSGESIPLP